MSHNEPEARRRSGWLFLLIPLVATLAAGAWFGRSYLDGHSGILATTESKQSPALATTSASPQTTATSAAQAKAGNLDLGKISGRYVLKGPAKAPTGSVVVFVLTGPKRAVHTDAAAPFSFSFDSARMPNGTYTVGVTVIRPGLPVLSQNRVMEVANKAPVKAKSATKASTATSQGASSGSGISTKGFSAQARQVLQLTNAERAKAGCKSLTASSKLTTAAQAHSADMAAHNYFAHDSQDGTSPFDRMKEAGYNFRAAAENIAYGQTSAASVMDAWMNSPGHKANILNCTYTQIGIGYATRGSTPYWTQDFGTPL